MMTNDPHRRAVDAFAATIETMIAAIPGGIWRTGPHDALIGVTGSPTPLQNAVFSAGLHPDAEEIARLAAAIQDLGVPWSLQLRGEPGPEVVKLAAAHGLTERSQARFMIRQAGDEDGRPLPEDGGARIRRLGGDENRSYIDALAAGFDIPAVFFAPVSPPSVLDDPDVTAYLAEQDGVPVCTGMLIMDGDHAGVYNISTPPQHRRSGHARRMTEAILHDAYANGARTAFLIPSETSLGLYESLGFRTIEPWTCFTPA